MYVHGRTYSGRQMCPVVTNFAFVGVQVIDNATGTVWQNRHNNVMFTV
jgi:hypothetical protein